MSQRIRFPELFLAVFLSIVSVLSVASPASSHSLMQCMTDCVKYEGNTASAKSTCKSRCANVQTPQINSDNPPSCMAVYKKCNRTCGKKDKACLRTCKEALMECK